MENQSEHIALLRLMAMILRERESHWTMSTNQQCLSRKGIVALDKAVEALEVQVYA